MPFTVTMPKLSPTMEEGTLVKWHKKEGDLVKAGEVMFEVATDKATLEHAALDTGYLRKILLKEGSSALVNQAVAIFTEKKEESLEGYVPEGVIPKAAPTPQRQEPKKEEKREEAVTASIATFQAPTFTPEPPLEGSSWKIKNRETKSHVSPLAKKLAKEKGIDLTTVKGTGPGERVMSRDIEGGQPNVAVPFGSREAPSIAPGTYEEEPLSPMRKAIGQRLQASKMFIPHFYITQEIRADKLLDISLQLKELGHKISINDFVIRACALALSLHPSINSGYHSETASIIRFKTIDISVAVGLESGLITPIIRIADYKNLGQIAQEMKLLVQKAKNGKLAREEYVGGSFTISNLGMFGVSEFVAIINPPQAAILSVGGIADQPVVEKGQLIVGKVMKITLSADHRVIDGAEGAKFLKSVQHFLENPVALVI